MGEMPTCPIVSAFSEVKSATGYPKCTRNACAWWAGSQCAMVAIADGLTSLSLISGSIDGVANSTRDLAGHTDFLDDWGAKDGLRKALGSEGIQNMDLWSFLGNLQQITTEVLNRMRDRKEIPFGG